jgi:transposase
MRGRKLRIEWREDESFWRMRYQEENRPEAKRRLQALWLVRRGYKLAKVAWLIGVHIRTVNRWLSWYKKGGLEELLAHRRGNLKGRKPFLTQEQFLKLEEEANQNPYFTTRMALAWVRENFGVNYSYQGMYSLLRRRGLLAKSKSKAEERDQFCEVRW